MTGTAVEHVTRPRRKYAVNGRCADCGYRIPTTLVHFWVNNMPYRVCKDCIKPYRKQLNKPCSCEGN
jgi:hypothetical protein